MKEEKTEGGYAILFTVVIVSIISMITIGLANTTYKQLMLASLARDSTTAFYQADIGTECALYADSPSQSRFSGSGGSFDCAGQTLTVTPGSSGNWTIKPPSDTSGPCFDISVVQKAIDDTDTVSTKVTSNGYNICDKNNSRIVQRTIEVNY